MSFNKFLSVFLILFVVKIYGQSTASQQVSKFQIEAPQLDTIKTIWVYLPKSYQNSSKRYPVTYMLDAQNIFDRVTSYAGEWNVDEYLDTVTTKETIVIAIEHGNEKRFNELSPYKNKDHGGGNGDTFLNFIIETVKPYVDRIYRTKKNARNTSIFGASLGGLMAFYAVIKRPDVFNNAGAFSPSFWFNEDIYTLVEHTKIKKRLRFYFLVGSEEGNEMTEGQERMVSLFKTKGVNTSQYQNIIAENREHNETLWREYFPKAYQWFIKH